MNDQCDDADAVETAIADSIERYENGFCGLGSEIRRPMFELIPDHRCDWRDDDYCVWDLGAPGGRPPF